MNNNYELVMIVTHQNNIYIGNLLQSVYQSNDSVQLLIVLVSQLAFEPVLPPHENITLHAIREGKLGTSKARNIGLKYLEMSDSKFKYVMFPDDDTTFDTSFFAAFMQVKDSDKCYLGPIFNVGTKTHYLTKVARHGEMVPEKDHALVGCPNQVMPYSSIRNKFYFNENLGPGESFGSCEDLDLFLRLNRAGHNYIYHSDLYSFHPAKHSKYEQVPLETIVRRFRSYSKGYGYIIFKYGFYSKLPNYFFRSAAGTLVYFFKLNWRLSYAYFLQLLFRLGLTFRFAIDKRMIKQV